MKKLWILFAAGFILTGCADAGNNAANSAETQSNIEISSSIKNENAISVTISVMEDGKLIEDGTKSLELEEGTTLLEAMKANFDIEEDNDFITSINGQEQDNEANKYWLFDINGEESMVGAADVELQEDDFVEFNLE
ncbi:DUF4430 domain-containing protein [Jeotgalibaca sp. MA1X17-3]|uniref:DUF4430 domain-containing protein n=1 Tax=Jeotgalibaca sp. MA1X17-3 TaxID=2908211 RepID=UPI001F172F3B|nr:DUF4430 domain-containing protein [Jeotgalibaca sp. MA1X17-3]UJF15325.1 DUF4430 domain-containing protein [Jeotgalibaca sp. MA1X17-3]